jgi:hypothetical protein
MKKLAPINDAIEKEIEDCIKRIACLTIGEDDYEVIQIFHIPAIDSKYCFHITVQEKHAKTK